MKLSVIIPYWNPDSSPVTDSLLIRAVRSAQDSHPYEIIVVNDGSPSDPDLSSFPDVRYLRREHGMMGAARNTGLDNSGGDVIAFLDADDYYYPGTLAPCMEAMEKSGADLLGFTFRVTRNETGIDVLKPCDATFTQPESGESFMRRNNLFGSACLFLISRKLIDGNGLRFLENIYIEDEEFATRLLHFSQRLVLTSSPVYAYYVHPGSTMTSKSREMMDLKTSHTIVAIESLLKFREAHRDDPHDGLDRKINTLAIDHLRRTLRRPDWRSAIPAQIQELGRLGLYPIDACSLPFKFRLFGLFSRCRLGRFILHLLESIRK